MREGGQQQLIVHEVSMVLGPMLASSTAVKVRTWHQVVIKPLDHFLVSIQVGKAPEENHPGVFHVADIHGKVLMEEEAPT